MIRTPEANKFEIGILITEHTLAEDVEIFWDDFLNLNKITKEDLIEWTSEIIECEYNKILKISFLAFCEKLEIPKSFMYAKLEKPRILTIGLKKI